MRSSFGDVISISRAGAPAMDESSLESTAGSNFKSPDTWPTRPSIFGQLLVSSVSK